MPTQPSNRMLQVQEPMIPVVGEWIAECPGTISLGQGIVHYSPPPEIRAAIADAIKDDARIDRYCQVRGVFDFLDEIESKLAKENEIDAKKSCVVATAGSNMGFQNAVLAIGDVGDEIILLSPFYFNHEMAIEIAGCKTVVVPTDANYQIELDALKQAITSRTKAIVTVSPSNPTGAVYTNKALTAVNQLCKDRGLYHISDEAYEYFLYDGQTHFSPGSLPDAFNHTISLYSLSKGYGMAGWRTAYMVIPQHLETAVKKVQDTNLVCPPVLNQLAAAAAMRMGKVWVDEQVVGFHQVRELVVSELQSLGDRCEVPIPGGAFYVLAKVKTSKSDMELVEALIRESGVAVMPGSTFGVTQSDVPDGCSVRIAYGALDQDSVAEGMGRLVRGLKKLL